MLDRDHEPITQTLGTLYLLVERDVLIAARMLLVALGVITMSSRAGLKVSRTTASQPIANDNRASRHSALIFFSS